MSIRAYCDCGRKLSVADDQAGKTTVCPACGGCVLVPKRGERRAERVPVMTTKFITQQGTKVVASRPAVADPVNARVTVGSHSARPAMRVLRRARSVWWESLLTPLDHLSFLTKWSLAASAVTVVFLLFLHARLAEGTLRVVIEMTAVAGLFVAPVVAVACEFLSLVASEASRVGPRRHRWISLDPVQVTESLLRWLACLAAGPAFVFGAVAWHWTICGELTWLDRLILFEGLSLGGGWLALAGVLTSGRGLRGLNPVAMTRAAWALGGRAVVIAAAAGIIATTLVLATRGAMGAFTRGEIVGIATRWLLVHFGMLGATAALLDLLGRWHAQVGEPLAGNEPVAPAPIALPMDPPPI